MDVFHRPMQAKDIRECVQIIANHPILGRRYGSALRDLPKAWRRLLDTEAKSAIVFRAGEGAHPAICFIGISVFVKDSFVQELKLRPGFWFGPELAKRILQGDHPILSDRQLREANADGGLNLLVWEGCISPQFEKDSEIQRYMMKVFIDEHRGFLLKEIIGSQVESAQRLRWMLKTGGLLWDPLESRYVRSLKTDAEEIVRNPHIIGITREIESKDPESWVGSWVGTLFDYHPPRFGFSPREQRLLSLALTGATDENLAKKLSCSLPTVKKMWFSIYRRAIECVPQLFSTNEYDGQPAQRGKEKRRHVLAYLREHPEELRPMKQKRLNSSFRSTLQV